MLRTLPLALLPALAACGALSREAPEIRAYVLRAERPGAPHDVRLARTLEVRRFRVSPGYAEGSFVYRRGEHAFEADFYHEFFASPADLLTEETRRWLDASGLFTHVVGAESRVLGSLVLESHVGALYGDYSGGRPAAVLEVQSFLVREPGTVVLLERTERVEEPLEGRGPDALVAGWNRALTRVLERLESALAELPPGSMGGVDGGRGSGRGAPEEAAPAAGNSGTAPDAGGEDG